MILFSEKMLISNRWISGLMSNLIKKSWKVSTSNALGKNMYKGYKVSSYKFYMYLTTVCCCRTYFKPVTKYAHQLIYISLYTKLTMHQSWYNLWIYVYAKKHHTSHTPLRHISRRHKWTLWLLKSCLKNILSFNKILEQMWPHHCNVHLGGAKFAARMTMYY